MFEINPESIKKYILRQTDDEKICLGVSIYVIELLWFVLNKLRQKVWSLIDQSDRFVCPLASKKVFLYFFFIITIVTRIRLNTREKSTFFSLFLSRRDETRYRKSTANAEFIKINYERRWDISRHPIQPVSRSNSFRLSAITSSRSVMKHRLPRDHRSLIFQSILDKKTTIDRNSSGAGHMVHLTTRCRISRCRGFWNFQIRDVDVGFSRSMERPSVGHREQHLQSHKIHRGEPRGRA